MTAIIFVVTLLFAITDRKLELKTIILAFHVITMCFLLPGVFFFSFYSGYQYNSLNSIIVYDLVTSCQVLFTVFLLRRQAPYSSGPYRLNSLFLNSRSMFMVILIGMVFFTWQMLVSGLTPFYIKMLMGFDIGPEHTARIDRTEGQGAFVFSFIFDFILPALCLNYLHLSRWFLGKIFVCVLLLAAVLTMGTKLPLVVVLVWVLSNRIYYGRTKVTLKLYLTFAVLVCAIFGFYVLVKSGYNNQFPYASFTDALYSFSRRVLAGSVIGGLVAIDHVGFELFEGTENIKQFSWSLIYGKVGGSATMPILINMFFDKGIVLGAAVFFVTIISARIAYVYALRLSSSNPDMRAFFLFPMFQLFLTFGISGPKEFVLKLSGVIVFLLLGHFIGKMRVRT